MARDYRRTNSSRPTSHNGPVTRGVQDATVMNERGSTGRD